jgi:hypothetical protein
MAVKKSVKASAIEESVVVSKVVPVKTFPKWSIAVAGLLALLVLYWYKTNTWPITAVVNGVPVMRYEVVSELYKQGGTQVVDSIVTEKLVRQELQKKGLGVTDKEIDEKIDQVKKSLGEGVDLNKALADRGMTMKDLRDQIGLQLGIEKAVAGQVKISDEDVAKYVKENGAYLQGANDAEKTTNAKETLRQSKLQEAINAWIESVRASGKVWKIGQKSS